MRVVRVPESFEAHKVSDTTTEADFITLYKTSVPGGPATVQAVKIGGQFYVTTSASPEWTGRFAPGDLIHYVDPIFLKLDPTSSYAEYKDIYITG